MKNKLLKIYFPYFFIFLFITGCAGDGKDKILLDKYYPLENFLDESIHTIRTSNNIRIKKSLVFNEESEELVHDTTALIAIFEILKSSGINKAALAESYSNDFLQKGNTSIIRHALKEDENALVKRMDVFFSGKNRNMENLRAIYILKNTSNLLYSNKQHIIIRVNNEKIRKITIDGFQKIRFFEPDNFYLETTFLNY